eukprot:879759-Rhodomonas_salina.1
MLDQLRAALGIHDEMEPEEVEQLLGNMLRAKTLSRDQVASLDAQLSDKEARLAAAQREIAQLRVESEQRRGRGAGAREALGDEMLQELEEERRRWRELEEEWEKRVQELELEAEQEVQRRRVIAEQLLSAVEGQGGEVEAQWRRLLQSWAQQVAHAQQAHETLAARMTRLHRAEQHSDAHAAYLQAQHERIEAECRARSLKLELAALEAQHQEVEALDLESAKRIAWLLVPSAKAGGNASIKLLDGLRLLEYMADGNPMLSRQ